MARISLRGTCTREGDDMFLTVSIGAVLVAVGAIIVDVALNRPGHAKPNSSASARGRLALLLCWSGLTGLLVTAYPAMLRWGEMRGAMLLLHTAYAPLFLAGLAAAAVSRIGRGIGRELLLIAGAVSAASILAAMSPWFGYANQNVLILIHKYCAAALLAAWILLVGRVLLSPMRGRREEHETQPNP